MSMSLTKDYLKKHKHCKCRNSSLPSSTCRKIALHIPHIYSSSVLLLIGIAMLDVPLGCGSCASISLKWNVVHARKNGLELISHQSHVRKAIQVIFSHIQEFSSMKLLNERNLLTTGRFLLIPYHRAFSDA